MKFACAAPLGPVQELLGGGSVQWELHQISPVESRVAASIFSTTAKSILSGSMDRRQREHSRNELLQKDIRLHEHGEVTASLDRNKRLAGRTQ